jgi:hypothetical protein
MAVLSNRLSTRNRRGIERLELLLGRHPDIPHAQIDDWSRLPDAVTGLIARELDLLVVNGGDGTLVGVLTELRRRGLPTPPIAVLASGNSNMIAGDVGRAGAPDRALSRLLAAAASGRGLETVERRLMRIDMEGEPTRYGFFVGALAIVRAIQLTRRTLHPLGVNHGAANAAGIALAALRVLFARNREAGLLAPVPVALGFDGEPPRTGDYAVILASTLDRLLFGATPFWGVEVGAIRATLVRAPVHRPLRSLQRFLRGRPDAVMRRSGYVSRNADRLVLAFDGPFAIDGEIHEASRTRPITLTDGGIVRFLRC